MSVPQPLAGVDAESRLLSLLTTVLDAEEWSFDPGERALYSSDVYSRGEPVLAIVRPRERERCAAVIGVLTHAGYALVTRGGGMSYTGGYLATRPDTVLIDTSALDRIVEVNAEDLYITVEAGVTWKAIYERLAPLGLRLPFFGTFSGAQATVGGGLSNGALFLGTARHGTGAENVISLEVALANGQIVRTGQAGFRNVVKPFYRTCGPDLTGLFLHESGSFGVKLQATMRLMRMPTHTGHASFVFDGIEAAAAALSEVARTGAAEDAYVFDPETTRKNLRSEGLLSDAGVLLKVIGNERGLFKGLLAGAKLAAAGRSFLPEQAYSLHVTCAARSEAALQADLALVAQAARPFGGKQIPESIPRAVRANLFPALDGVIGAGGDRWAALNAKVAHSDALRIIRASTERLAPYRERMQAEGVWMSHLLIAIGQQAFSFEPVFHWHDEWLPLHERMPAAATLAKIPRPVSRPGATALVAQMRAELVELFAQLGAASNQLGKTYPYHRALHPQTAALVSVLKHHFDPQGLLNPDALELPAATAPSRKAQ